MSWHDLEPILHSEGLARDAPQLVGPLRQVTESADQPTRDRALGECVAALGGDGQAMRLLRLLSSSDQLAARRLALELAARLPSFADPATIASLRPLLRDRRIPAADRLAAAVALVRAVGPMSRTIRKVLRDFAAGFGRARFLERLPVLRQRFGPLPALERYAARLRDRLPLRCPRCGATRRRSAMIRHLWRRHRLLLEDGRARSLWRMLGRWLDDTGTGGPLVAYRQLLRHGVRDSDAFARLRADADRQGARLCPQCYAAVPLDPALFPAVLPIAPLQVVRGRLSGHGFVVDVSESGLVPRLRVETPHGVVYDGRNPRRWLTVHGQRWLGVGTPILLAIALAIVLPPWATLVGTPIAVLAALEIGLLLWTQRPPDLASEALDHAWRLLAPLAHADGFAPEDAAFFAGLARESIGRGDAGAREQALCRLSESTTAAVITGQASLAVLAPLLHLQAADAARLGGDAVRLLADAVGPCFDGERPLGWADLLLTDEALGDWTPGQRARLRVLLAARAFAAGLGVWELHELIQAVPGLARVFDSDDTDGLARLRLLWDLRPGRPWQRCGPAATVFELAKYPMLAGQHLEAAPDLLLFQPLPAVGDGKPDVLLVCGRGLILRDALVHERSKSFEVRPLPNSQGGGFTLQLGTHQLTFPEMPKTTIRRLEEWSAFFFDEFLPRTAEVLSRPVGLRVKLLLEPLAIRCPECGAQVSE